MVTVFGPPPQLFILTNKGSIMAGPIHEVRRGLIKVQIRKRKHGFTVSLIRLYRDGEVWKESARLGPKDIPLARLVLDRAYAWILESQAEQAKADRGS